MKTPAQAGVSSFPEQEGWCAVADGGTVGEMREIDTGTAARWVALIVVSAFGLTCAALILAGVAGPTVWFTVLAMALLAVSQALFLVRVYRRRRRRDQRD
jgi:Flp pilus assembly protein TadB